ncbi:hypothetical protein B0T18DRAFT_448026 [Schizothecium vesticola]|uniref:Uncharacterized protein n=1 Tax=Schizothecium vesticola TaxID=314040 RepID=A0AA40EPS5_9PEZI|nr:hypothetical protein B0T18DRAFT_448026 [Schizothecium vesticola]
MTARELDETPGPKVWAEAPDGAVAGTESTDSFRCGTNWEMNQPPARPLYIFLVDGLGAALLSGAINFALAYAMYVTPPPTAAPIRLWQLPSTLAGDAAVTIIVQNLITWCLELALVNRDLARGAIAPLGFLPVPKGRLARWFFFMDRKGDASRPGGWRHWGAFWASQVVRAMVVSVGCFAVVWPVAVGVLMGVGRKEGGDYVFERRWAPQVFKLVLGAVLGGVTTPAFVVFWLARAGWAVKVNEGLREAEGEAEGSGEEFGGGLEGNGEGAVDGRPSDEETVVDGGQESSDLDVGAGGKK